MLNTVKHLFHNAGDTSGDLAHRIRGVSGDLAKVVGSNAADVAKLIGEHSADIAKLIASNTSSAAKKVGSGTVDLAHRIGPKRGILGFVALVAAVGGGVVLVRYLRSRRAELDREDESMELSEQSADGVMPRRRRGTRAQRKASNAISH
ncbi:MAG: hypothetical protein H0T89_35770 [Deltaproteobacteria bacterium]|nr:hypothetical protein [Deltaproteobacteria bacterium]MDQ3296319.1 hypothetical protein [Myxococcota bacterium]